MIFNEWTYAVFLLVGVLGFAIAPPQRRPGWLALVGAAFYAFYGGVWLTIFLIEILLSRLYRPRGRLALLGITQAVLILAVVKYGALLAGTAGQIAALFRPIEPLRVNPFVLPLGLSFFLFEFIHYAADRYNGKAEHVPLVEYASFILFFPTMIAGPIKRIQDWTQSLARARVNPADLWGGLLRVAVGIAKKSVLADNLNNFLEFSFNPETANRAHPWTLWFNMVIYAGRIYLDFSAYSDIAIGSAQLFGIRVKENFNWPYVSRNPSEFWRRWHISLSRWITDYLFIPLGGSRGSWSRVACNILVAMGLSGLWHGAAGNFVVWGLYHAVLLICYRTVVPLYTRHVPEAVREHGVARAGYRLLNFGLVVYGWVFFAMPLSIGARYAARMVGLP